MTVPPVTNETLLSVFPTAEDLLDTPIEDLAPVLLRMAGPHVQSAGFVPRDVTRHMLRPNTGPSIYSGHKEQQIEMHLSRAWNWAEREGFIEPSPGMNGQHGWRMFTPDGKAIADGFDFHKLRAAREFPKVLIHPTIRDKVWRALMRGDLDDAVSAAFKAVEVAVREAANLKDADIGVNLMKDAFKPYVGHLTDRDQHPAEQEAVVSLFTGAIGLFKNPQSHREVKTDDVRVAQEQVMIASHLLRIVDARRKRP